MARFAILFALIFGTAQAAEPGAELAGNYSAVAVTRDGKAAPDELVKSITVKIMADELTFTVKDKNFPSKIKLNEKVKPATIDIEPSEGPEKGRTFLGIYKLEKGELTIAYTERGDRPTAFKSEKGAILFRLKKDAPEK